ncbi:nucleotidyltransferase domain-containing protein [Acinetobacter sp. HY1485]|uniref:nucleotidyltransferase domain-containing protein n=1 Tax=Acinetobacter sp. HY1485 TaxID=2970918 RepID=UPI0022B953BD|nr:nucleotidyltransferase domain-containing protein [Acinetobacter sp. HY1485]
MNINQEIEAVFCQRDDIPLFYIESGSRLWGMASPDSDYDVRGFHMSSKSKYYDYKNHRDLIEIMNGDFDFVSYDLDKMFGLLAKSNPNTLEWVRAHIEYLNHIPEWQTFRQGLLERIEYSALHYHYLSLAMGNLHTMQKNHNFTYKKVFYCIRGLMSAELATRREMPKLFISSLFGQIQQHDGLREWAEYYLEIKKQKDEKSQLSLQEQEQVVTLLENKIRALQAVDMEKSNTQRIMLEGYLTDYSVHLKNHFYG